MTKYKVWIHIEQADEERNHCQEIGEPKEVHTVTQSQLP
jgi:hypothetical protein